MTYRPGVNLLRGLAALLVISPLAFVWSPLLPGIGVALVIGVAAAWVDGRRARTSVRRGKVERHLPPVAGRGATFSVTWDVQCPSDRLVRGQFRDQVPGVATPLLNVFEFAATGGAPVTCECRYQISQRGRHQFGPAWLRLEGPWRLIEAAQAVGSAEVIKILPETFASREHLVQGVGASFRLIDAARRSRCSGPGTEFESLRPFHEGDDPRRIDWRSSARLRSLVVRQFRIERHRDVMILFDAGRLMGAETGRGLKLDFAVDAALNLARVVVDGGDRCGAAAFDSKVRGYLPPLAGPAALKAVVDCFYDLEVGWRESNFLPLLATLRRRQSKRSFLIVISDVSDPETSGRLSAALASLQKQHVVLFAAIRTPLLGELADAPAETTIDVARTAVAMRLLRDRGRALHVLRRGGVHVVDVDPEGLTVPLINRFVELRQQNLL